MEKAKISRIKKESVLYPVQVEDRLLNKDVHKAMQKIAKTYSIPSILFEEIYWGVLQQLARWVQVLDQPQLSWSETMLHHSVSRMVVMMDLAKDAIQALDEEKRDVYAFMVFSASLLFEVAYVSADRMCFVSDKQGRFVKIWDPLMGPMVGEGEYYKVRFTQDLGREYIEKVTPLLAMKIMPTFAVEWLHEDPKVFLSWVNALTDLEEGFSSWGFRFDRQELLGQMKNLTLADHTVQTHEPKETEAGEAFWAWLKEQLEEGKLPMNSEKSPIHHLTFGLLVDHEMVFRQFAQTYSQYKDWLLVYRQFEKLGLTRLSGKDHDFEAYKIIQTESQKTEKTARGGMFSNAMHVQGTTHVDTINNLRRGHLILNPHMFVNPAAFSSYSNVVKVVTEGPKTTSRILRSLLGGLMGKNFDPGTRG